MTWGYQLMVRLPPGETLGGEERQTWTLPMPVGPVDVLVANATATQGTELTFRSAGFDSGIEAEVTGSCLRDWLRLDSALEGRGLDLGTDQVLSQLGSVATEHLERQGLLSGTVLVPDVHGLTLYECEAPDRPVRFAARARGTVEKKSEVLKQTLRSAARFGALTDRQSMACDLLSLVRRETSGRARLLAVATAMEVLADRRERRGASRDLVNEFIAATEAASRSREKPEEYDYESLLAGLRELSFRSTSTSTRDLAKTARPDNPKAAATLATRIYKCRSSLIHGGRAEPDMDVLVNEGVSLVRDMVRISGDLTPPN